MDLSNLQPETAIVFLNFGGILLAGYAMYIVRKMANGQNQRMVEALENNTKALTQVEVTVNSIKELILLKK